jgi:hypothetical protein
MNQDDMMRRTAKATSAPFLFLSGLYRRPRSFTGSAVTPRSERPLAGYTAGGELRPALRNTGKTASGFDIGLCSGRFKCRIEIMYAARYQPVSAD